MQRYDFRTQRLFVEAGLGKKASIEVERKQANYLLNVLRLKKGDHILLFNGRDGEWLAVIEPDGRKSANLVCAEQTRKQPQPSKLIYCFCPLKQARLDYMVQKAVEMGAGILQPVISQHTQISKLNLERVHANAIEAAEQCGVLAIPELRPMIKLPHLIEQWDKALPLIFCDEMAQQKNPLDQLNTLKVQHKSSDPLAVLIGPEGGFSNLERELLNGQSFVTSIALGSRILRADTAAVAALSVVQAMLGDW